jgi:hypothetical protein
MQSRLLEHVRFFDGRAAIDATGAFGVDGTAAVGTVADLRGHAAIGDAITEIDLANPGEQFVFRNSQARAEQFPHGLTEQCGAVEGKFQVANSILVSCNFVFGAGSVGLGFCKSVYLMHVPHECAHKLGVGFGLDVMTVESIKRIIAIGGNR